MRSRRATARPFPWTAAILAFAAASRVGYLASFRGDPFWGHLLHDAQRYHAWATAAAQGRAFETGAFSQAPLYPWLLGLVYRLAGPSPGAAYVLQCALGVATVVLVATIARRAYGETASACAAGAAALSPALVFFETKLLPATLGTFLAVLLVERLQAARRSERDAAWIAPGVVLGAAGLASSALLLAGLPAAVWACADRNVPARRRAGRAALLAAAAALVVLPVTVRNRVVSGEWVLVATNGGITLWQGNNPAARGVYSTPDGFSGSIRTQREEARALAEAESGRAMSDAEASRHWARRARAFLAENPSRAARLLGAKLAFALASREQPLEYDPNLDENPWRRLFVLPFGVVAGLAAVRPLARARDLRAEVPIAFVAATVIAILLVFYVSSRYRLPALALLCAPAGAGAAFVAERVRQGAARAALPAATAAAIAAVSFAVNPVLFSDLERTQSAMALGDRGAAQRAAGKLDASVASYRRAVALDPAYAYLHLDLAKSLRAGGRAREAESEAREAVRLAPVLAEGWRDLGVILYEANRLSDAEAAFRKAWELDPADADSANNLAGTRLRAGDLAGARVVLDDMRRRGVSIDPALENVLPGRAAPPPPPPR